jgi:hypothetical protein
MGALADGGLVKLNLLSLTGFLLVLMNSVRYVFSLNATVSEPTPSADQSSMKITI